MDHEGIRMNISTTTSTQLFLPITVESTGSGQKWPNVFTPDWVSSLAGSGSSSASDAQDEEIDFESATKLSFHTYPSLPIPSDPNLQYLIGRRVRETES